MKIPDKQFVVEVKTPELSKLIQEKMFEFGYGWRMGKDKDVKNTDKCYLFFDSEMDITWSDDEDYVDGLVSSGQGIKASIDDIFSFVQPQKLKVGILKDYPITLTEEGLTAGCQTISRADFEDLVRKATQFYAGLDAAKPVDIGER